MKNYIRDNGKIRKCDSNIDKMSYLEYIYHDIFTWKIHKEFICGLKQAGSDLFDGLYQLFFVLIAIIIFPMILFKRAKYSKKCARKEVEWHNKCQENMKEDM